MESVALLGHGPRVNVVAEVNTPETGAEGTRMTTRLGYDRQPRQRPTADDLDRYQRLIEARRQRFEELAEAAGDRSGHRYRMNPSARAGQRTRAEQKRSHIKGGA